MVKELDESCLALEVGEVGGVGVVGRDGTLGPLWRAAVRPVEQEAGLGVEVGAEDLVDCLRDCNAWDRERERLGLGSRD